jgi:hypothetical protein
MSMRNIVLSAWTHLIVNNLVVLYVLLQQTEELGHIRILKGCSVHYIKFPSRR